MVKKASASTYNQLNRLRMYKQTIIFHFYKTKKLGDTSKNTSNLLSLITTQMNKRTFHRRNMISE